MVSDTKQQWFEICPDGVKREVHDPARIPANLLEITQVKILQAEVLKLRSKARARREALRDSNRALERYQRLSALRLNDRNNLLAAMENQAFTTKKKCECS